MKGKLPAGFHLFVKISLVFSLLLFSPALAAAGDIELVSVGPDGVLGNGHAQERPSISADGRFVAFSSSATNLVEGMTISGGLYVHDRETDTTELVSVSTGGTKSTGSRPSISADGRYVAFWSASTTLVTGDTNSVFDIFVRDRELKTTVRVSVSSDELQSNGMSWAPQISADGTRVAFYSTATNLVSGDTNGYYDIFVRDLSAGTTTRVSMAHDGTQLNGDSENPSISADGRYVAYTTYATNAVGTVVDNNPLGDIIVRDTLNNTNTFVSATYAGGVGDGGSMDASISTDGRYVAFVSSSSDLVPGDTNYYNDIFVRDLQLNTTTRVSVKSNGDQATGGNSEYPHISGNGRFVTFSSLATNLVDLDTNSGKDVFIHDRLTGETIRASVNSEGIQGNLASMTSSISANGYFVSFFSTASNLVLGDTNGFNDIFVYENGMAVSTCTWTGSAGTNWDNPANWSSNFIPTKMDLVIIPDVENNPIVAGGVVEVASLTIESNGSLSVSTATFHADDVLIQANGLLTVDGSTLVSNNLEIEASAELNMTDAVLTMADDDGYLTNYGDLYAHNDSQDGLINGTVDAAGTFINYGTIHIDGVFALNIEIPFNNQGAIEATGGEILIDEGSTLSGSGSLTGDLVNAGTVIPGESPGILTIDGDYTQQSTGALEIELGGTEAGTGYDQLVVTGSAILGGTLNVSLLPGFEPQVDQVLNIITYGTGTYEFDTENLPELTGGLKLEIAYSDPGVTLTVISDNSYIYLPLITR